MLSELILVANSKRALGGPNSSFGAVQDFRHCDERNRIRHQYQNCCQIARDAGRRERDSNPRSFQTPVFKIVWSGQAASSPSTRVAFTSSLKHVSHQSLSVHISRRCCQFCCQRAVEVPPLSCPLCTRLGRAERADVHQVRSSFFLQTQRRAPRTAWAIPTWPTSPRSLGNETTSTSL